MKNNTRTWLRYEPYHKKALHECLRIHFNIDSTSNILAQLLVYIHDNRQIGILIQNSFIQRQLKKDKYKHLLNKNVCFAGQEHIRTVLLKNKKVVTKRYIQIRLKELEQAGAIIIHRYGTRNMYELNKKVEEIIKDPIKALDRELNRDAQYIKAEIILMVNIYNELVKKNEKKYYHDPKHRISRTHWAQWHSYVVHRAKYMGNLETTHFRSSSYPKTLIIHALVIDLIKRHEQEHLLKDLRALEQFCKKLFNLVFWLCKVNGFDFCLDVLVNDNLRELSYFLLKTEEKVHSQLEHQHEKNNTLQSYYEQIESELEETIFYSFRNLQITEQKLKEFKEYTNKYFKEKYNF